MLLLLLPCKFLPALPDSEIETFLLMKLQKKNVTLETQKDKGLQIPWLLQDRESEWLRNKFCQSILMYTAGTGLEVQPPWELGSCGTHSLGSGKALCLVADF